MSELTDYEKNILNIALDNIEESSETFLEKYRCNDEATVGCFEVLEAVKSIRGKLKL